MNFEMSQEVFDKIVIYRNNFIDTSLDTKTDKKIAEESVYNLYAFLNYYKPKIIWGESPLSIHVKYNIYKYIKNNKKKKINKFDKVFIKEKVKKSQNIMSCWQFESYQTSIFKFIKSEFKVQDGVEFGNLICNICSACGCIYALEDVCFISEKPVKIYFSSDKIHNDKGPAILYSDGFGYYFYNGSIMSKKYFESEFLGS